MQNSNVRPFSLDQSLYNQKISDSIIQSIEKNKESKPFQLGQQSKLNNYIYKTLPIIHKSQFQFQLTLLNSTINVTYIDNQTIQFFITTTKQNNQKLYPQQKQYNKIKLSKDEFTLKLKQYLQTPQNLFAYLKEDPFRRITSFNSQTNILTFMVFKCITKQYIYLDIPSYKLSNEEIFKVQVQKLSKQNVQLKDQLLAKDFQIGKYKNDIYNSHIKICQLQNKINNLNQQIQRISNSCIQPMKNMKNSPKIQNTVSAIYSDKTNSSESKSQSQFNTKNHQGSLGKQIQRKNFMSLSNQMIIPHNNICQMSFISNQQSLIISKLSHKSSECKQSEHIQSKKPRINHFTHLKRYLQKFPLPPILNLITQKKLQGTKSIFLQDLKIKQIPSFPDLLKLETLAMDNNKIEKIQNLWQLQNLENLHLSNNKIKTIQGVEHLHMLKTLNLSKNQIVIIQNISRLRVLQKLYLDYNQIKHFSQQLCELKKLQILKIRNNKINWKCQEQISIKIQKKLEQGSVRIQIN